MSVERLVIGILAHVDAGKTTLSEGLLFETGAIAKQGRVDHGSAFLDTDAMERSRGITIFSKQALFKVGEKHFTLVDTPGHSDFSAEMERMLRILDAAVLVISAPDGIGGHEKTLWRLLAYYGVPTILFVNKMDQPAADRSGILAQIREELSRAAVPFQEELPNSLQNGRQGEVIRHSLPTFLMMPKRNAMKDTPASTLLPRIPLKSAFSEER